MALARAELHPDPVTELRREMAAAFRWAERYDLHEAVANHFSVATSADGRRFLVNPSNRHWRRIRASDLIEVDADDAATMERPDAPDPTAWGLHSALHRLVPHARCAMHVHSHYATALACLEDCELPPIDQNAAAFYRRQAIDTGYGGMAFEEEGARCAAHFDDPAKKVMVMGNHGILVIGETVGDAFSRLYTFERACRAYLTALSTGRPLRVLPDAVAERTAREWEAYPVEADRHLAELRAILDGEGSDYAD